MGAKQGGTKGNEQKAEYLESGRAARETRRKERRKDLSDERSEGAPEKPLRGGNGMRKERKKQRLSSQKPKAEADERKRKQWRTPE